MIRDVAQSGLEYTSGGRGVGGSNPLIPTGFIQNPQSFIALRVFYFEQVLSDLPTFESRKDLITRGLEFSLENMN